VKHLAKQVLYVLKYLHDSVVQDSWPPQNRTVNDQPINDDYPDYYSDAFASAASTATEEVLLQDLTQPEEQGGPTTTEHAQHPSHANNDDDDDDDTANDNFNDLNGPSEGNESLLESNGSIPDTFEAVDAFPLDDF
jgi:hypothetical protein